MKIGCLPQSALLLAGLIALSGCARKSFNPEDPVYASASDNYEIESVSEQLDQELAAYPTRFIVSVGDGKASLERAFFFFKTYTSKFSPENLFTASGPSATARNINLTNENSRDAVLFRVSRVLTHQGFRYSVSAASSHNPNKSPILAANLARFIKEGRLEVSLLTKVN